MQGFFVFWCRWSCIFLPADNADFANVILLYFTKSVRNIFCPQIALMTQIYKIIFAKSAGEYFLSGDDADCANVILRYLRYLRETQKSPSN
jgi:hypothetical protein